jgi:hypothetical protein
MWSPPPPLPPRVRSQPQRLAHEQEDERLHADEAAELLRAMRLSIHPESGSETDTDSNDDSEEKSDGEDEDEVDEEALIDSLDGKEREKYDAVVEDEEKRGWTTYSPITRKPFAVPAMNVPVLNGCSTPLDFFHALLPLTFFDHVTERSNAYAEQRRAFGKENTPPSMSTRSQAAEDEEGTASWTPTTVQEILAFVGCVICMGMVKVNTTSDYWSAAEGWSTLVQTERQPGLCVLDGQEARQPPLHLLRSCHQQHGAAMGGHQARWEEGQASDPPLPRGGDRVPHLDERSGRVLSA